MYKKKEISYFILLIALLLFMLISTFGILAGKEFHLLKTLFIFIFNLPLCLLMAWLDLQVVNWLNKKNKKTYSRYLLEFLFTVLMLFPILFIGIGLNQVFHVYGYLYPWKIIIFAPMILSNCMFFLLIEAFTTQERLAKMAEERAMFQFEALKNQINPHFLFNSLNVLSSLTYESADTANAFTKKLAQVYRYLLDTQKQQTVSVTDEMTFVDNYIYLERIRYQHFLQIEISGRDRIKDQRTIPTSIQMLVENAIKHNKATNVSPLHIQLEIDDTGIRVSNNIQLRDHISSHGIGLRNLGKQLMYYGKNLIVDNDGRNFTVTVPWI
jgi:sensor histidine kinase YesM